MSERSPKGWIEEIVESKVQNTHSTSVQVKNATSVFNASLEKVSETFKHADEYNNLIYGLSVGLYMALFALGIVLTIASIIFITINNRVDVITTATSALALADFIALFLIRPLTRIRKIRSDLIQMGMIYTTWLHAVQSAWVQLAQNNYNDAQIKIFQETIDKFTADSIKSIEDNIGKD